MAISNSLSDVDTSLDSQVLINTSSSSEEEEDNVNQSSSISSYNAVKKIPVWRIVLLSAVGGAIDLGYAVEGTYGAPLLVAAGLDIQYASIMLALSPLLGIVFQAYLGTSSDNCRCSWGRRRPFILLFCIMSCLGLGIAPFAPYISTINELSWTATTLSVIITVLGIVILDFSLGQLQLPSRAYLMDSLQPTSQVQAGNFIYVLLIGAGTLIGFILSGVNWVSLIKGSSSSVINQAQFVFGITAGLILLCLIATLVSVKETNTTQEKEARGKINCSCNTSSPIKCISNFWKTIYESLNFVWNMSRQMWWLWAMAVFGFTSNFTFLLFFTTFIGGSIYGGISSAPEDSQAYQLYAKGVRNGSWALAFGAGFLMIASILLNPLTKLIGMRSVFLSVQYLYVMAMFVISVTPNMVLGYFVACFGLLYQGVLLSIPFTLLSLYEVNQLITTCYFILGLFLGKWYDVS